MLHITLGPEQPAPRTDPLHRSRIGYSDTMTEAELYEAGRGTWVLGARADNDDYALLTHDGIVRQAIVIDRIVPLAGTSRRAIEGRILTAGDPVYDTYVNKPSPVGAVRNPITYFTSTVGNRTCRCGCGITVTSGEFLPGHDQRAIHERIGRIGSVSEFLDWFDNWFVHTTAISMMRRWVDHPVEVQGCTTCGDPWFAHYLTETGGGCVGRPATSDSPGEDCSCESLEAEPLPKGWKWHLAEPEIPYDEDPACHRLRQILEQDRNEI